MVQIDLQYQDNLRCRAVHGPSGTVVLTDAPVDNHGLGESFSPTDLVATALASCMVTIMGIAAQKHDWRLEGVEATANKVMVADPLRRIGKIEMTIRVPGEWSDEQREVLEKAALTCPVSRTLQGNVEVPLRFEWGA